MMRSPACATIHGRIHSLQVRDQTLFRDFEIHAAVIVGFGGRFEIEP
jgi:hypothetical protein